eukprot:752159-Hanusia_phi.AAC.1
MSSEHSGRGAAREQGEWYAVQGQVLEQRQDRLQSSQPAHHRGEDRERWRMGERRVGQGQRMKDEDEDEDKDEGEAAAAAAGDEQLLGQAEHEELIAKVKSVMTAASSSSDQPESSQK